MKKTILILMMAVLCVSVSLTLVTKNGHSVSVRFLSFAFSKLEGLNPSGSTA